MATIEHHPIQKQSENRSLNILLGILLLIPAVLACGASQLAYSAGTIIMGLQKIRLFTAPEFIGLENYAFFSQDKTLASAFGFTAQVILVRLLMVAIVPLLLAWGASLLGRRPRLILRVLFTLPIVAFTPVAIAMMWSLVLNPNSGIVNEPVLGQPDQARQAILFIDGLYTLGLACGLGLVFYLAAFRNPNPDQSPWKPILATWGIGLLAAAASSLQSFALSYVLTNGGPMGTTTSLILYLFKASFIRFTFGYGAALATIILVILALLGLVAGSIAVFSNLKIRLAPSSETMAVSVEPDRKTFTTMAFILALLISITAGILSLLPLAVTITTAMKGGNPEELQKLIPLGSTLVNTILPPLISVLLIQTPITYLGALGIGALRPLGKRSEWLLLPFCPWLFVGLAPLGLSAYQTAGQMKLIDTFVALISPVAVSIPMLVLLTLFFKGQEVYFREAQAAGISKSRAFFTKLVIPSLPLVFVLAFAGVFASMQDLFWPLIFVNKTELYPINNVLLTIQGMYATNLSLIANALLQTVIPISLFFFLVFGVFQIFYLDRLSISSGSE
jgi:ABC-type sugar transport system permease subunit